MTTSKDQIAKLNAVSLMDLLAAQCSDLEALLALARRETLAAEKNDFSELMAVAEGRATLGERLESYHRQIADMRALMGGADGPVIEGPLATQTIQLAVEIQAQDAQTTALLVRNRLNTAEAIVRLDQGRRNSSAYMRDARAAGLTCDRRV